MKDLFIETLEVIQRQMEFDIKASDLLGEIFVDGGLMMYPTHDVVGQLIKILEHITEDEAETICYFIYDLDFGRAYTKESLTEMNGDPIDISTSEKLYDYLIWNKNNK